MAIYNGRILMRKGNEADFDPEKMMAGEWAISLDKGIVRMCIQAGVCIRMATYEAFEEDMLVVENILKECKTIEEAVRRINTEINAKVDAVVEYVGQAKTYRDEAEQFRNEAKAFRDNAEQITGIGIATTKNVGIVRPDGTTITVDEDGTIHSSATGGTQDYTDLINKPKINGVELNGDITSEDLNIKSTDSVELTQADYDALPDTKYTDGINYYITDAGADSITASNVGFNDSVTQLGVTTTQKAIEKVNEKVGTVSDSLTIGGFIKCLRIPIHLTSNGTNLNKTSFFLTEIKNDVTAILSYTIENVSTYGDVTAFSACFSGNTHGYFVALSKDGYVVPDMDLTLCIYYIGK